MVDNVISLSPRLVRAAPEPLALWLRPGRMDHRGMLDMLAAGKLVCFGAIFDPTLSRIHSELREQILRHRLDAILDPKTQPAATLGGYTETLGALPWGLGRPHSPADFEGITGRRLIAALGDFALENGFTQVIAPTHFLSAAGDPWFHLDIANARYLRDLLDRRGGGRIPIIYSLAVSYAAFRDKGQRGLLVEALRSVPASEIWLKLNGFGTASTSNRARTYIEGAADFHELGIPIVADHVGGVAGLSLVTFGQLAESRMG